MKDFFIIGDRYETIVKNSWKQVTIGLLKKNGPMNSYRKELICYMTLLL